MTDTTAETMELRPSDQTNLADDRIPCPACLGAPADDSAPCDVCRGRTTVVKPTGRDHLSHSSIATLLNCQKRFDWHYVQRLDLIARPRPLGMGAAFHRAIELSDPKVAGQVLRQDRQVLSQQDEDSLRKDEAIVTAAAGLYLDRWGTAEGEQREYEYRVRLRSPWTGRPSMTYDLLGYADGLQDVGSWLELTEVKLVGQIDAGTVKRLPLDRQVALASYGCWRATGKPVRVVHYRHVRKPSVRQKKNESVAEFCERLVADYRERPDFYADEQTLFRSDDDLLRIEAELWRWAEMLREAKHSDFWARNTSVCGERGGCPYIALCVNDPDAPSLYRRRPAR